MAHLHLVVNGSTALGNGAPTVITDGVPIFKGQPGLTLEEGFHDYDDEAVLLVEGTVTASATGSIAFVRLWGWFPHFYGANKWAPLGTGADTDKGKINEGAAIGEHVSGVDAIRHSEVAQSFRHATRLYAEYGALTDVPRIDVTLEGR